jgi:tetratricopeptide (TPR) repeat protein/O-antigen ligase
MARYKTPLNARQLFIFGIILYFTFIGGSFYSDLNFPLRVLNQVVVTALLGSWLIGKLRRGEPFPHTALDAPILAWLAVQFIAAFLGLSPRFSLEKLWTPFTYVLAFYLLVDLRRKGQTASVARGLYMSAGVVCLVGLTEFASWYFGLPLLPQFAQGWPAIGGLQHPFPPTLYRLNFTLNGATPLSAYLALLIPPALGILLTTRNRDDRHAIAAWLVLAIIVEGLSLSRGGVLALLVSLPLTGLGWWLARRRSSQAPLGERILSAARRPVIVGALALSLLVGILVGPTWLVRTFDRSHSTQFRFTLWEAALTTFREHPLTGAGPYNFGRSLLQRNDPDLPRRQIMTAHNIYLNTAAELGLLGLAVGGWLLLAAGRAWLTRWHRVSDSRERVQVAAAGAALAGLAAHSLVDTFAATPNVLPMLAIAAFALIDSSVAPIRQPVVTRRPLPRAQATNYRLPSPTLLALLALVLYAAGLAWLDVGQFHFQRSIRLAARGNLTDAIAAAEQSHQLDPAMPLYTFQLAYLQGRMTTRPEAPATAATLYQAGLAAEPVDGRQTANLAAVLWQIGDRQAAINALARTVALEPDPLWLVNLGYLYQQIGDTEHAIEAYGQALALSPGLAGSEFWQAEKERAEHWPDVLAEAETTVVANGQDLARWRLQVALARRDWPTAVTQGETILEGAPEDCTALSALARAMFETGRIGEAQRQAQEAINAYRACGSAYTVRGLTNQAMGNLAAAERDWRAAIFLNQREAAYYLGQFYQAQGDVDAAARFYLRAISPSAVPTDVEITLYDRRATFDLLPPLFRIGISPKQAEPWLALARLREIQGDFEAARQVYQALLVEDPYLEVAQERLDALPGDQ